MTLICTKIDGVDMHDMRTISSTISSTISFILRIVVVVAMTRGNKLTLIYITLIYVAIEKLASMHIITTKSSR